ncbi:probable WRKY transcription factor 49 isoform X2 [Ziziphus jujuba]|uniref:Probable WRKY transcription factor 49 isoform X2 n=1 Tax=Ziziphus jujuba TaxID=326968 RepID=A0ABM3I475_ZIZJJ|nr:probable WRKY transcription factor 49 isoform X2 [Ziziphus jujuba]
MEETIGSWSNGSEEELVRELLDDESPLFVLQEEATEFKNSPPNEEALLNRFNPQVYSGPTIDDIENALSVTTRRIQSDELSPARVSLLERGLSKIENKYTLKIKSCGNGMADDGYKWRKYGQKSIKNSPNPRCTNPRCSAKKQVERSSDDPETFIITYEGLHLHFAYPFFFVGQPQLGNPPIKKTKKNISGPEAQNHEPTQTLEAHESLSDVNPEMGPGSVMDHHNHREVSEEERSSQGLLQDVVPLMILNPSSNTSSNSSCSSYRSPPTSPSSLSWPLNFSTSYFDVGINSSIM